MSEDRFASAAHIEKLESSLERLERRFKALERRMSALENEDLRPDDEEWSQPQQDQPQVDVARTDDDSFSDHLGLIGRSLVVLGGAYLLRAVTEFAVLPRAAGVSVGFLYALLFVWIANREAVRERARSAMFHGCVAAIIAYGLVWESAARFEILSAPTAAAIILVFALIEYVVVARRNLPRVAWFVTLASGAVLASLVVAMKTIVPFGWALLLLVAASIRTGRIIDRRGLAQVLGLLADFTFLVLAVLSISDRSPDGFVASVTLLTTYFLFFSIVVARRVVSDRTDPSSFGVLHIVAATAIGALGAMRAAVVSGAALTIGLIYLGLAPVAYSFGFAVSSISRRAFSVFTTLGLVLVISSSTLTLPAPVCVVLYLAATLVAYFASSRQVSGALDLQIAVYLWAAAFASGILGASLRALAMPATSEWGVITPLGMLVLVLATAMALFGLKSRTDEGLRYAIPRLSSLALIALSIGGTIMMTVREFPMQGEGSPAHVALIRTIIVASAAIFFAWISRYDFFRDTALLVYPILILGGMKLLTEDLRVGGPETLFVTLALYGGVLIVTPRIRKGRSRVASSQ